MDRWQNSEITGATVCALEVSNSQFAGSSMMPLGRVAELPIVGLPFAYIL